MKTNMTSSSRAVVVLAALLMLCCELAAQNTKDKIVEPSFPGGCKELLRYMEKKMVYPVEMQRLGKSGEVVVEFYVERSGVISGVNVVKSLSKEFDDEAIRLTRYMPRWNPGTKNGKPMRFKMTMPINFKLKRKRGTIDKDNNREFINELEFLFGG